MLTPRSPRLTTRSWILIVVLGLTGQLAWTVENMYLNVFVYDTITDDPNVWEFKLREGVKYHNGNPFTADDVVFSILRAKHENSDMKGLLTSVVEVTKVDEHTVRMRTDGPNPLLPNNLTNLFIMDREWSEANKVTLPQN